MRIALILEAPLQVGGGFQQALSTIQALRLHTKHQHIVLTPIRANVPILAAMDIPVRQLRYSAYQKALDRRMRLGDGVGRWLSKAHQKLLRREPGTLDRILTRQKIDLTVFLACSSLPLGLQRHSYITTVFDLCHRDWPEFPEIVGSDFQQRETTLRTTLPRALAVVVNAASLAEKVHRFYGVSADRLVTFPLLPAIGVNGSADPGAIARVRERYRLPKTYIFYPAQAWPHKNHVYLIEGLKRLETLSGIQLAAVFCGSDMGHEAAIRQVAMSLGLSDRVHFLGFVPNEDISSLYSSALAMVMPTYFGPTNIPPLEALRAGTPVIYSDFPEFREHLGDSALYCDLKDPASLAKALLVILQEPGKVAALKHAGQSLLERLDTATAVAPLARVFDEFDDLRRRWDVRGNA